MKKGLGGAVANAFYRARAELTRLINNKRSRFIAVNAVFAFVTLCVGLYFKACFGADVSGAFISVNLLMLAYITYYRRHGLHSGGVQLTFLFLFVVFNMTVCCELISNDSVSFIDTPKFLLNLLLYASLYYAVFFISNSAVVTLIVPGLFWGILSSVNYFLNDVRGRPLFLSDLFSIGTAMIVADEYVFTLSAKFLIIWFFMIFLSMHVLYMVHEFGKKNLKVRFRFRAIGVVAIIAVFFIVPSDSILKMAGVEPYFWTHKKNGFPLNFIMDLKYSTMSEAEGYSPEKIGLYYVDYNTNTVYDDGTLLTEDRQTPPFESDLVNDEEEEPTDPTDPDAPTEDTEDPAVPTDPAGGESGEEEATLTEEKNISEMQRPNVIVIMNETFSDMRIVGDFDTNKEFMPFIDSLSQSDNAITGYSYVSVFGGGTADSEYEFLLGDSMYIYAQGAIPYQLNFKNSTYISGAVETFNTLGYKTVSLHPYLSSGWNRPNVYSAMRFDEQYYQEAFDSENTKYLRNYISDESDYEKLIELYEQKDEDEPFFIFNVTMQNHGGYGGEYDNFNQQITLPDYPGQFPKAEQYLSLMYESDKAVEKLIGYFENVDEPTVILFYGDHQGTVEEEFYDAIRGKSSSDLSAEEMQSKYITKFFIWANYDLDTSWLGENEDKHDLHTSVNYLSSILFKAAGIPTSAYQNFLFEMRKTFPIITAFGIRDANGEYYTVGNKSDEIYEALRPYEMMIYNHVYDKKNVYLDFFCLRTNSSKDKPVLQKE